MVVNGSSSDALPVLSGVPPLVGPLLFLIYIDGIKSITLSPDSLYADDMLLYRSISSSADYALLQDDIIHFLHMFPWFVFLYHYLKLGIHAQLAIIVLYCVSFAHLLHIFQAFLVVL